MEKTALEDYIKQQHQNGHHNLYAIPSSLIVSSTHPFLAATPDAAVYDPSSTDDPFGFAEIKCTYKYQDITPEQAASHSDFMLQTESDGRLTLKKTHVYFSQVQGQMGVGERKWCDFIVYIQRKA